MVSFAGVCLPGVTDRHKCPGKMQVSSGGRAAKLPLALHCPQASDPTKMEFLVLGSSLGEQSNSASGAGEGAADSEPDPARAPPGSTAASMCTSNLD